MREEMVDVVDEENNLTGVKKSVSEVQERGLWHRTVHVWIFNDIKEVLLQLRGENMILFPGLWDISVAGHISSGEESIDSALREIKEEIGLSVSKGDLVFFKVLKREYKSNNLINKEFCYIYFCKFNGARNKLKKQDSEVTDLRFVNINDFEKELKEKNSSFVPHKNYYSHIINKLKELKKDEGVN